MIIYAQLHDNIVTGISYLSGEVISENMIDITDFAEHPSLGDVYDTETQTFTAADESLNPTVAPSIEEQILAENQYQTALLETQMLGGNTE